MIINLSKQDHRTVLQFTSAEGCNSAHIHRGMVAVHGENRLLKTIVMYLSQMFRSSNEKTMDLLNPSQAHRLVTNILIADIGIFWAVKEVFKGLKNFFRCGDTGRRT